MARDIHLEGFRTEESKGLFSLAKDMISSWVEKPQEKSTVVWLGEEFIQRVGGMTTEAAQELSSSIMDGVDQFTENMNAIEETYRSGGTKETWLQQKLLSVPGATEEERARYLAEAQVALAAGNNEVYAALHSAEQSADLRLPAAVEERVPDGAGGASWQPIPAQVAAQGVAEQAVLAGVGGAALDTGLKCAETQDGEPLNTGIDFGEEPTGSETDRSIKAVATGALYVAVERGIVPFLKKATPLPVLTNIACWGVEGVRTTAQVFSGKLSVAAAVDRVGRIASAAIGDLCSKGIGARMLSAIPVVGPVLGMAVGSAISSQSGRKIAAAVHAGFKIIQPAVTTVAEGLHKVATKAVETVKSGLKAIANFLGF